MTITRSLIAVALIASATPLVAEETQPAAAIDKAKDKVVCRTQTETGSRLNKKKICMTLAEWRDLSFRQGQSIEKRTAELPRPGG